MSQYASLVDMVQREAVKFEQLHELAKGLAAIGSLEDNTALAQRTLDATSAQLTEAQTQLAQVQASVRSAAAEHEAIVAQSAKDHADWLVKTQTEGELILAKIKEEGLALATRQQADLDAQLAGVKAEIDQAQKDLAELLSHHEQALADAAAADAAKAQAEAGLKAIQDRIQALAGRA